MRSRLVTLVGLAGLLVASLIDAPFPQDQRLQHVPTVIAIGGLAAAARWEWLSTAGFYGLVAFLALHVVGARWCYSNVPYDAWAEAIFGGDISGRFGWKRNHFDRLVHLAFGMLAMPAAVDLFRRGGCRGWLAVLGGVCLVTAAGAAYEVGEWQIAVWLAPDAAEKYNGQQGDAWDAQKDLAIALAGSGVAAAAMGIRAAVRRRVSREGAG